MAENCNGVNIVDNECSESAEEAIELSSAGDDSKNIGKPRFRGFIPVPHVRLERYDITPYLNNLKKQLDKNQLPKKRSIDEVHAQRLSQECSVKIKRDDLEKLRAAFQRSRSPSTVTSSDSEVINPSDMAVKCKICDKSYNSEKKLLKHQQNKHIIYKSPSKTPKRVSFSDHVIVHEVKEYHKCRKCSKIFEDYKTLKQHMRRWHKKRKCYICNYCNTKFVDRMFFKVHIRLHCDFCGSLSSNRSMYLKHKKECQPLRLHKCKCCTESFFKIKDLKEHSYSHFCACYVCDICKQSFKSKCAIAHHIAFLHSKSKRPKELYEMHKMGTERLYLCNFCDESSVERGFIERHIQDLPDLTNKATTGYKDYYFCDQCLEQFETETDMLQHKWSHFLKPNEDSPRPVVPQPKEKTYNINETLPDHFKPYVLLEKLEELCPTQYVEFSEGFEVIPVTTDLKKAIVDPKSKKTIISRHQCEICGKYFSNNYGLNRHIKTLHEDLEDLRCKICEETFVWPSLLKAHKCIRLSHPEMPFQDARAEILFENMNHNGFEDIAETITGDEDYMNSVDFDIPAPIVELRECDTTFNPPGLVAEYITPDKNGVAPSYKLIMQEVPIEF